MLRTAPAGKMHIENAYSYNCLVNIDGNIVLAKDQWHFVVEVVDRKLGAKLYINGSLDSEQQIDTSSYDLSNGQNPVIGFNNMDNYYEPFNGAIDDVAIFNKTLTGQDVNKLFLEGRNSYPYSPVVQSTQPSSSIIPFKYDINKSAVAYYPFNGNAKDVNGFKHNGEAFNVLYTSDRFGNAEGAAEFNGQDSKVVINNSPDLEMAYSDYSIAAWIKPYMDSEVGRIFSKGSSGCVTGYMLRTAPAGKMHIENAYSYNCLVNFDGNIVLAKNEWHFVVGVVDRKLGGKLYINGSLDSEQQIDTSSYDLSNGRNPVIGYNDVDNSYEPFNGAIDDVAIFNKALSQKDVDNLFLEGLNYIPLGSNPHGADSSSGEALSLTFMGSMLTLGILLSTI